MKKKLFELWEISQALTELYKLYGEAEVKKGKFQEINWKGKFNFHSLIKESDQRLAIYDPGAFLQPRWITFFYSWYLKECS